jgi:hypothetical protein
MEINMVTKKMRQYKFAIRSLVVLSVIVNAVIVYMAVFSYYNWKFVAVIGFQLITLFVLNKLNSKFEWIYGEEI